MNDIYNIEKHKISLVNISSNPYGFFTYLKLAKSKGYGIEFMCDINPKIAGNIKLKEYYDYCSFKIFLCELVYNAVNLFPSIDQYTMHFKNENGQSRLIFGLFQDIGDDGHPVMAKLVSDEGDDIITLNLKDIKGLYCNNRHDCVYDENMEALIVLIYNYKGYTPDVKTSYRINPDYLKNTLKFK